MLDLASLGSGVTRAMAAATGMPDLVANAPLQVLCLLDLDGPTRPSAISDVIGLTSGGTTKLLDRLEGAGLVERSYGVIDGDHRGVEVVLTTEGRTMLRAAAGGLIDHLPDASELVKNIVAVLEVLRARQRLTGAATSQYAARRCSPHDVPSFHSSRSHSSPERAGATTRRRRAPTRPPRRRRTATTPMSAPVEESAFEAAIDTAAADFFASPSANGATALYVSVSDPQEGDVIRAYGDASVDGPAATTDDNFRIGSITKTFTATVILQLVDEGELALDDTVEDVLPDLAVDYPDLASLSVEQLLAMQTGVADYLNVPDSVVADIVDDPTRVWGIEELIAAGVGAGVDAPGTPGYSTTNFLVLQLMAEMVTDTPLRDLIAERITTPLELDSMFLPANDDTALPAPVTSGYVADGCVLELEGDGATVENGTDVTDWNASYGQGGGGMTSTISDLAAWGATLTGNQLLADDLADARLQFTDIGGLAYGLGIMQLGTWIGHEGEAIGWESISMHDPESGVTVALAANGCGGVIAGFAEFLDALYPEGGAYDALSNGPSLDDGFRHDGGRRPCRRPRLPRCRPMVHPGPRRSSPAISRSRETSWSARWTSPTSPS